MYNKYILSGTIVLAENDSNQTHAVIQAKHFLFFNLKMFSHRISNILPLKDFLSFICGKTRWVSQVIHSYRRNNEKNLFSEARYPLFFTRKQIICLDGNLLYSSVIADICGVSWKMRCSVSRSYNLSLCIKSE